MEDICWHKPVLIVVFPCMLWLRFCQLCSLSSLVCPNLSLWNYFSFLSWKHRTHKPALNQGLFGTAYWFWCFRKILHLLKSEFHFKAFSSICWFLGLQRYFLHYLSLLILGPYSNLKLFYVFFFRIILHQETKDNLEFLQFF